MSRPRTKFKRYRVRNDSLTNPVETLARFEKRTWTALKTKAESHKISASCAIRLAVDLWLAVIDAPSAS